jgi:NADH dehydrogenase [ubiquinone] 1 alpha subcomplex assembly factor 1
VLNRGHESVAPVALARDNAPMARDLFRFDSPASVLDWTAVNDGVMGGLSRSRLRYDEEGCAVFAGVVSLANNGGFASVRSRPLDLGAPAARAYELVVRGDGHRYKLNLRMDDAFDGINYQAGFTADADAWMSVQVPVSALRATFRGREVPGATPFDPARVRQAGLMIADRQAGAFALAIRALRAVD